MGAPAGGAPGRRARQPGGLRSLGAQQSRWGAVGGCAAAGAAVGGTGGECLPACCPTSTPAFLLAAIHHLPPPPAPAAGGDSWQMPEALRAAYDKAQHAAELRQPYETSVAAGRPADADLLAAYMAYVKVEERQGDPTRVQASPSPDHLPAPAQLSSCTCLLPAAAASRAVVRRATKQLLLTPSPALATHPLAHTPSQPCLNLPPSAGCV